MSKLTPVPAKIMFKILWALGFQLIRVKGSHHFFYNKQTNKTTTIPFHAKEDLGCGLIREILRDIELSVENYDEIRRKTK